MKKNLLFGLLTILVAGFGFGGVSMATEYVATIGNDESCTVEPYTGCYETLQAAIDAAGANETITVLENLEGVKDLDFQKSVTIKAVEGKDITIKAAANSSTDVTNNNIILGMVKKDEKVTFEGIKFDLSDVKYNSAGYAGGFNLKSKSGSNVRGADNIGEVEFVNCKFKGRLTVVGKATFDGCTFDYFENEGYNVEIRSRDTVVFDECTFNGKDRNINIYDPKHEQYVEGAVISFNKCIFDVENAEKKGAIVIHEQREKVAGNKVIDSFNVVVTEPNRKGTYPTTPHATETRAKMFSEGIIMVDDYNTEVLTNGGNVVVTVDGVKIYSTPMIDENGIVNRTVTFDSNGGAAVTSQTINDGSKATQPTLSRSCYTLNGWYNGNNKFDFNNVITENITLKANWTYSCSTSGGSGKNSSSSSTSTKKEETKVTTGNNEEITLGGEVTEESTTTGDVNNNEETKADIIISDATKKAYDNEQLAAYQWAYENDITTINDADEARLGDPLTRSELAKMMSQYISSVLKRSPIKTDLPGYKDVDESLGDLADYIVKAYQYQIMGIDADGNALEYFNPNGLVTRAEYATVFSRVLYGSANNQKDGPYYEKHLAALKEAGILSEDDPTIQEVRGWVMLMMYRSANEKAPTPEEPNAEEGTGNVVGIANPASTYCVEQEGEIEIREDAEGAQYGVCKFKDGTEVEEWEYFRANHKDETTTGTVAENATGAVATTGAAENN